MGAGSAYLSPMLTDQQDNNGITVCIYQIFFSNTAPNAITSITAYNLGTSPYTQISVERTTDGLVQVFPLPTSGSKTTVTTLDRDGITGGYQLLDAQGNPTSAQFFHATVTQAIINSKGFFNLADIGTRTAF